MWRLGSKDNKITALISEIRNKDLYSQRNYAFGNNVVNRMCLAEKGVGVCVNVCAVWEKHGEKNRQDSIRGI